MLSLFNVKDSYVLAKDTLSHIHHASRVCVWTSVVLHGVSVLKKNKKRTHTSMADGTVSYRRHLGHLTPAECGARGLPVSDPGFITQRPGTAGCSGDMLAAPLTCQPGRSAAQRPRSRGWGWGWRCAGWLWLCLAQNDAAGAGYRLNEARSTTTANCKAECADLAQGEEETHISPVVWSDIGKRILMFKSGGICLVI